MTMYIRLAKEVYKEGSGEDELEIVDEEVVYASLEDVLAEVVAIDQGKKVYESWLSPYMGVTNDDYYSRMGHLLVEKPPCEWPK